MTAKLKLVSRQILAGTVEGNNWINTNVLNNWYVIFSWIKEVDGESNGRIEDTENKVSLNKPRLEDNQRSGQIKWLINGLNKNYMMRGKTDLEPLLMRPDDDDHRLNGKWAFH